MKEKVNNRIESDLFQVNKTAYLVNGNKNWSLLRKHVYLVEEYCKKNLGGKIPGKQNIETILEKALTNDDQTCTLSFYRSKQSGSRKRENPTKPWLERRGIEFPSPPRKSSTSTTEKEPSRILYTAPKDVNEEAEQLAIVIRESLRQKQVRRNTINTVDPYASGFISPAWPYTPLSLPTFNNPMVNTMTYSPMSINSLPYPPVGMRQEAGTEMASSTCTATSSSSTLTESAGKTALNAEESEEIEAASLLLNMSSYCKDFV
jgi:hypothetical protein